MILGENYMGIFSKIMGTHSERELKRVYPIVDKIEAMGSAMEKLSDEELRAKTDEFKKRLSEGETLDDLLVEAYAVVREAATRVLGMRHYRVQLIGGVLHTQEEQILLQGSQLLIQLLHAHCTYFSCLHLIHLLPELPDPHA